MWSKTLDCFGERVAPRDLPELMDGVCDYEEFRDCLISLEQVNRLLLGYRPTLAWLDGLPLKKRQPVHILDVGCGGGDLLRKIARWAEARKVSVKLTGIDLNPFAARAAKEFTPAHLGIDWITGDALSYTTDTPVDIVVSSLMTHHLEEEQIVTFLQWMEATARAGWFINDLERSGWNSLGFAVLAKIAGWHRFVKHDGPVSFRRALVKEDWERLLTAGGMQRSSVTVESWLPGRLCVGKVSSC